MTVWFWDPSFHTEDDWETHYNYYRRFKHSLMLQKEKPCIKSRGVNTFECEDQGKFNLICLLSIFWRAVLNEKNMIFRQNNKNVHWKLKDISEEQQFNFSGQTRDSRTTKHKHKTNTAVDHSAYNTVLRIKRMETFKRGHFYKSNYYFILWTTCKHLLCEISY